MYNCSVRLGCSSVDFNRSDRLAAVAEVVEEIIKMGEGAEGTIFRDQKFVDGRLYQNGKVRKITEAEWCQL